MANNEMSVISDDGHTAVFSISALLYSPGTVSSLPSYGSNNYTTQQVGVDGISTLDFNVRDGYRITSLTISGLAASTYQPAATFTGSFYVWEMPSAQGGISVNVGKSDGGWPSSWQSASLASPASGAFALEVDGLDWTGQFSTDFYTNAFVEATGFTYEYPYPMCEYSCVKSVRSSASLALSDITMTVEISPVPEPHAWMMLLAGISAAAWGARRRQRHTQP